MKGKTWQLSKWGHSLKTSGNTPGREERWEWDSWNEIVWDKSTVWFERPIVIQIEMLSRQLVCKSGVQGGS